MRKLSNPQAKLVLQTYYIFDLST